MKRLRWGPHNIELSALDIVGHEANVTALDNVFNSNKAKMDISVYSVPENLAGLFLLKHGEMAVYHVQRTVPDFVRQRLEREFPERYPAIVEVKRPLPGRSQVGLPIPLLTFMQSLHSIERPSIASRIDVWNPQGNFDEFDLDIVTHFAAQKKSA